MSRTLSGDSQVEQRPRERSAYSVVLKIVMRPCIRKAIATTAFILIHHLVQKKKRKKPKRFWIKTIYKNRLQAGNRLFEELCFDDAESNFTRMNKIEFENLYSLINAKISKKDTNFREAITTRERFLVTLRFLATGDSYTSLQYLFRISKQRISVIVPEVCDALIGVLKDYVKVKLDYFISVFVRFLLIITKT